MVTSIEVHEKAKDIIRVGLDAQFKGKVRFDEIRITPRPGADDEEYLDVQVIYEGKREELAPGLLNSLHGLIEADLRAIGIDGIPSISYRDKTEDSAWSPMARIRPPSEPA